MKFVVAQSTDCHHVSAMLLSSLVVVLNLDPCYDFYDFACGSFVMKNYTPDESVAVDTFIETEENIDMKIYALLNDENRKFLQLCSEIV
ncbi:CLUMA_CG012403, isoform A [Clunio marinus]|uniref:CLUMA_CG012403, isoform A n=1 Tax=Clunio marinus TaxID=568069 RepID=A0A1J1IJP7_9DIPT|nr:CLUMA_CG012403, isoform A [Clunio marinus]